MSTRTNFATRTNSFFRGNLTDLFIQVKQEDSSIQFDYEQLVSDWNALILFMEDNICPGPKKVGKTVTGM